MAEVKNGRFAAEIDGDFVVFLIGMRINNLWAVHKWLPVSLAMPRMLKELKKQPELGLLEASYFLSPPIAMTVQYWRSFEQLHAYAHAEDKDHLPAWAEFNQRVGATGVVGVFHETYIVSAGKYEAVYVNMPRMGLALAGEMVPAVGRMQSAKERMGASGEK
ncbi:MAG TPA: DUF4188 domain-containing protein [Acidobacteriaceae bacterium]|nr:DUF4188 domain-containing protein [Acidobacteriaceae bacterium]